MAKKSLQLGRAVEWPDAPEKAKLDRVPNPQADTDYVVRFTAPEFTSLCPVTGQPDFAHLVIDYVPGQWLLESKSLKLYLASFRNHGAFHEDCTVMIGKRIAAEVKPKCLAHRRLLVSARRHPDRRVLADRQAAEGHVDPRPGRRALSRAGLIGAINHHHRQDRRSRQHLRRQEEHILPVDHLDLDQAYSFYTKPKKPNT